MTPEQFAQFEIFNQLNFWGGLFLGLIISGFFKSLVSIFNSNVQRPKRIRFSNLNGRHERKDNFEYLYLYKNEYYRLEQRDFLVKERLKNIRSISKPDFKFIFTLSLFLIVCLLTLYLSSGI